MSRRSRSFNAFEQATTAAIDDAVTSIPLDSVANLTPPGYLVIDPDNPLLREYIFYTDINALVLDNVSRGLEGSAGGVAQEHSSGARVRAVAVHQWLNDIFDDIEDLEALQLDYLLLDGSRPMVGNLDMGGGGLRVIDMGNGISDQDAATLKQVTDGDGTVTAAYIAADLLLLPLDGSRPMTGALKISLATGGQIELEDPGGAAPDTILFDHDEGITKLGDLLTLNGVTTQIEAHTSILIDDGVTSFNATYSLSQIVLGKPGSGASAATSFLSLFAGGDQAYDARIVAVNGTPAVLGDADLQLRARSTAIISDAGAGAGILSVDGQVFASNNTAANPSYTFNSDSNTGMYRVGADILGWSVGSNRRLSLDNDKLVVGNDATAAAPTMHTFPAVTSPAYAFNGDLNMGMYRVSANRIGWSTSGVSRMQIASGEFICTPIWANQIAASGDVHTNSAGVVYRSTSSGKYKKDYAQLGDPFDVIRRLNPVSFLSTLPASLDERFIGFVAEEVGEVIPEAAEEENYDLRSVVAYLVKAVQELAPAEA